MRPRGLVTTPGVGSLVFVIWHGALSLLRFETFHSRSLDMAYYVRLVWGLAHGTPDQPIVGATNLLGLHLEPVLLPLAGLARLGLPIAGTLLVVQTLATAAAIFPATAMARRRLGPLLGQPTADAVALSVLLMPAVSRCLDYDFHPSTMAVWPLMAFVNALDQGRWRRALGWSLLAMAHREDVGLQVGLVAATLAVFPRQRGDRLRGAGLTVLGLAWFLGYVLLVQPHWLPPAGTSSYGAHFGGLTGSASQASGGAAAILSALLSDPVAFVRRLLETHRISYPVVLLLPVALLPLLAPRWLAGALPLVGINMLSDLPGVRAPGSHYVTAAMPFVVAAAIAGTARMAPWLAARLRPRAARVPAYALVAAATVAWLLYGASPAAPEFRLADYRDDDASRRSRALVRSVPADASITAPAPLLAHLAGRPGVWLLRFVRPFPPSH